MLLLQDKHKQYKNTQSLIRNHMKFRNKALRQRLAIASIVALLIQALVPFAIGTALAVTPTFTYAMVKLDRIAASNGGNVFTSGTVCANFSAANFVGLETTTRVVFPTGFTVSTTASDWAVNTTSNSSWPSGAAAWTGAAQPTNAPTGQTVDFVSGDVAASGIKCFNWTNTTTALKTPTTSGNSLTGSVTTRTGAYPGTADNVSTNYAVSIIGSSTTADQIVVTATVPPTFVFALSGNAQAFSANLDPASTISTNALTATVTTNAASGYVVYVKGLKFKTVTDAGSNPANRHGSLESATAGTYEISNNTASSLGTASHFANSTQASEDYGFAVNSVAQGGGGQVGTGAIDAAYTSSANTTCTPSSNTCLMGVIDPTNYRLFGSSGGTSNGDVYTFVERANIAGITPAATDYTDTLTIIASGKF
jgi:hypothetical protein